MLHSQILDIGTNYNTYTHSSSLSSAKSSIRATMTLSAAQPGEKALRLTAIMRNANRAQSMDCLHLYTQSHLVFQTRLLPGDASNDNLRRVLGDNLVVM